MKNVFKNLPRIVAVDYYHEFMDMTRHYQLIDKKIKVVELDFDEDTCSYIGLVYYGRAPTKADIRSMLRAEGVLGYRTTGKQII